MIRGVARVACVVEELEIIDIGDEVAVQYRIQLLLVVSPLLEALIIGPHFSEL